MSSGSAIRCTHPAETPMGGAAQARQRSKSTMMQGVGVGESIRLGGLFRKAEHRAAMGTQMIEGFP